MSIEKFNSRPEKGFFIFLFTVLIYILLFPAFQFDHIDGGYIISYSWRIVNGQIPFKEFIMTKPPFSAYIHAFFITVMPERIEYLFTKCSFYLFIATYSYLFVQAVKNYFAFDGLKLNKYLLASVCFVFSAHNFPAMPWQTTDGILFSVTGIYLISKKSNVYYISGMLFLFLAALTKQSFYIIPFIGLLLIYSFSNFRSFVLSLFFLLIYISLFFCLLTYLDIAVSFINWTKGSTFLSDFFKAGIWNYTNEISLKELLLSLIIFFLFCLSKRILKRNKPVTGTDNFIFFYILFSLFFFFHLIKCLTRDCPYCFPFNYGQLLFLGTFIFLLIKMAHSNEQKYHLLLAFLMISWCAGLSWGHQTPLLFAAPFIFGTFLIIYNCCEPYKKFYNFLYGISLFTFLSLNMIVIYPNRINGRGELYNLGEIFPKLTFNFSDKETYKKYAELKYLAFKYKGNFQVLPEITFAHYITDTYPVGLTDWMTDKDINFKGKFFLKDLEERNIKAFIEKKTILDFQSEVRDSIKSNWKLIEKQVHFDVYSPR